MSDLQRALSRGLSQPLSRPLVGAGGGTRFAIAVEIESVWYAIGLDIGGTVYMLAV